MSIKKKCIHSSFKHIDKNIFYCFDCKKKFKLKVKRADCFHFAPPLKLFKHDGEMLCQECYLKATHINTWSWQKIW